MSQEANFWGRGVAVSGGYGGHEVYVAGAGLGVEYYGRQPHPLRTPPAPEAENPSQAAIASDQLPFTANRLGASVAAAAHRRVIEVRQ
jgi:hypothetical protein